MKLLLLLTYLLIGASFLSCKSQDSSLVLSIEGSSTVYPIVKIIAQEYNKKNPNLKINIDVSGTGGGFKKFCAGKTDINNASRIIRAEEIQMAKENNVKFFNLPVALDGITVVINKNNTWVTEITTDELKKIWIKDSKIYKWSDIRPNWPDRQIRLYGPGTDSGTHDHFSETINGKLQTLRYDFTKSEDDNELVSGVSSELDSLGYFGFSYFKDNQDKIKAVAISYNGKPNVTPDPITINNGSYTPFTRVVYIYVNTDKLKQKYSLRDFLNFFMEVAPSMVTQAGYIQLNDEQYKRNLINLEKYNLQ